MLCRTFLATAVSAALATPVLAVQATRPATGPATATTAPAPGDALRAVITGVEGLVQVRAAEDQPWEMAKAGMVVGGGAEFRTGTRSAVRFTIPPGQTITLDRLGTCKVLEAVRTQSATFKTDLGMQYGRVRYDIEAAGEKYDATIHSPGSTLAVRGTKVSLLNQAPFAPVATRLTGKARYTTGGATQSLGEGEGKSQIEGDGTAAETAQDATFVDPALAGARGSGETDAMQGAPVLAGFTGGVKLALPSIRGTRVTPTVSGFVSPRAGGSLLFQLVWASANLESRLPDLDLFITSPTGEQLCPKGCGSVVTSGGRSPIDDRGSSSAEVGQERAVWLDGFPTGRYTYQVRHVRGPEAEYQVLVLRNGRLAKPIDAGSLSSKNRDTYSVNIRPSARRR